MSTKSLQDHLKLLNVGRDILSGLKSSSVEMDDVIHDMEFSDDHNKTAEKLCHLYDSMDKIPDIPKRRSRRTKKATN